MATTFVPGATACADRCDPRLNNYIRTCEFTNGAIHSIAFTQCGVTIDCPSNLELICQLYDNGQIDVIPAIGDVPPPEKTTIESPYPCKRDQVQYWTTTYPAELCFEHENQDFWLDICKNRFGQVIVTLKNGLSKIVHNLRALDPYDFSADQIHKLQVDITERHLCGVKQWFPTGIPLWDETCLE